MSRAPAPKKLIWVRGEASGVPFSGDSVSASADVASIASHVLHTSRASAPRCARARPPPSAPIALTQAITLDLGLDRLDKLQEARRRQDRKLVGEFDEVLVPRDEQRVVAGGERDQIVVGRILRAGGGVPRVLGK